MENRTPTFAILHDNEEVANYTCESFIEFTPVFLSVCQLDENVRCHSDMCIPVICVPPYTYPLPIWLPCFLYPPLPSPDT